MTDFISRGRGALRRVVPIAKRGYGAVRDKERRRILIQKGKTSAKIGSALAKKSWHDGVTFDSLEEARRAISLRAGIKDTATTSYDVSSIDVKKFKVVGP